jgi:hypothetical protein
MDHCYCPEHVQEIIEDLHLEIRGFKEKLMGLECEYCGVSADSHGEGETTDCGVKNPPWVRTEDAMAKESE